MENKNSNIEIRTMSAEHRAQEIDGKKSIEGYAILFNHESRMIYEQGKFFIEKIQRGALDEVLANPQLDVIITPNHNFSKVIGRTTSGTLKLEVDERGLKYRVDEVPNISYALDMYESIKRGDTFESSFTFAVGNDGQNWSQLEDGTKLRTITKISYLKEVSPVTDGAYSDTKVAARSLEMAFADKKEEESEGESLDIKQRELQLLKLKR